MIKLKKGNLKDSLFDKVQLRAGMMVEKEHTSNSVVAKQIAKAHLVEDKNYYKKLKRCGL